MGMSNSAIESTYSERVEQRYVNLDEGTFVEAPKPITICIKQPKKLSTALR